jgi:hypothetical protein
VTLDCRYAPDYSLYAYLLVTALGRIAFGTEYRYRACATDGQQPVQQRPGLGHEQQNVANAQARQRNRLNDDAISRSQKRGHAPRSNCEARRAARSKELRQQNGGCRCYSLVHRDENPCLCKGLHCGRHDSHV